MRTVFLFVLSAVGMAAHANLILNGSFEGGVWEPNGDKTTVVGAGSSQIAGWSVVNTSLAWIENGNPFNGYMASHGSRFLDLTGYSNTAPYSGVYQMVETVPGMTYLLTFDQGVHPAYTSSINCIKAVAAGTEQVFTAERGDKPKWVTQQFVFKATAMQTKVELLGALATPSDIGLDNVSMVAVPEPGTLLALGLGGLLIKRRRK